MKGYSLTSISLVYKYTFSLLLDGSGIYKIGAILAPLTTAISFLYQSFVQMGQNVYEVVKFIYTNCYIWFLEKVVLSKIRVNQVS